MFRDRIDGNYTSPCSIQANNPAGSNNWEGAS
jgi:hypothetical protein